MARPGIKLGLFNHSARQQLSSSNWLLLGIQNVYIKIGIMVGYYSGADSIRWYRIARGYACEIQHKHRVIYRYDYRFLFENDTHVRSVDTRYLSYKDYRRTGEIHMSYRGTKYVVISRQGKDFPLTVSVKHGPQTMRRKVETPKMTLPALYKYCYNLMVLINGGPLEI